MGALRRRDFLSAGLAATLAGWAVPRIHADASQPSTPVNFSVPRNACDSHTHIFCNPAQFCFWPGRTYTPETASVEETRAMHRALRIDRIVLVNSLVYSTDNSCMISALRGLGDKARGIALVAENVSDRELDSLHRERIRGIRLNFVDLGTRDEVSVRRQFRRASKRIEGRGWHIQIYSGLSTVDALQDEIGISPVPVVFDHFARTDVALGPSQSGFGTLLKLLRSGKAYVKLSAPYRISTRAPAFSDVAPLAKAIIDTNPERVLWGSDWPHPDSSRVPGRKPADIAPLLNIDDGLLLNQLAMWAPDEKILRKILVDNPERLYEF